VTLVQLLSEKDSRLLPLETLDWPENELRGIKIECRYGSNRMRRGDWLAAVDAMVMKKMSVLQIALYGCWSIQYDGRISEFLYFPVKSRPELKTPQMVKYYSPEKGGWIEADTLPPIFENDLFGEICEYAAERGLKIIPMWNSFGHNTLLPRTYPEISAKEEDGSPSGSAFCTSNEKTYEVLFSIYDQIVDNCVLPYGFDTFAIGLDEVGDSIAKDMKDPFRKCAEWCRCPACRDRDRGDIFIDHAVRLISHLKEKGIKHVLMACDMIQPDRPRSVGYLGERLLRKLEEKGAKDSLLIGWWSYHDIESKTSFDNLHPELGLRRYVAPWNGYYIWSILMSPLKNTEILAKMNRRDGGDGIMAYSMWDQSFDRVHDCIADFAWNTEGAGTAKDVTERYARRHFPARFEEARQAFSMTDLVTEEKGEKLEGAAPGGYGDEKQPQISPLYMMVYKLSGYFHSYVKKDMPYPEPFIPVTLSYLLPRRRDTERALYTASTLAHRAAQIYRDLAKDPSCDTVMADRFAYESENQACIADDWLAVLEMTDLLKEKGNAPEAAAIARGREKARLAHLARLEQVKEKFAVEGLAGRLQSTFLVLFRDLAAYLEKNPDAALDLTEEHSGIFSEDFWKLR
jgi:hypothetical protein